MDIEKQLEVAAQSDHLVLIVFYADWSPHYEWICKTNQANNSLLI